MLLYKVYSTDNDALVFISQETSGSMGSDRIPRVIGDTVVAQTRFLVFKTVSYLNKLGEERLWDMVSRVGGRRAVMIVPFYGDRLVITREFRVPLNDYEYGFPAGLIDDGETAEEAGIREMREETGLEVREVLAMSPPVYNSPGLSDEAITLMYARVDGEVSRERLEPNEDIETLIVDRTELAAIMNDRSRCIGAKAWIEFYHYLNNVK